MSTFAELAPIISGAGITKTQADNYFANIPEKPAPQPDPTITKAKIVTIANALYKGGGIEGAGGIKKLASDAELNVSQVKQIIKELEVLHSEYKSANQ